MQSVISWQVHGAGTSIQFLPDFISILYPYKWICTGTAEVGRHVQTFLHICSQQCSNLWHTLVTGSRARNFEKLNVHTKNVRTTIEKMCKNVRTTIEQKLNVRTKNVCTTIEFVLDCAAINVSSQHLLLCAQPKTTPPGDNQQVALPLNAWHLCLNS